MIGLLPPMRAGERPPFVAEQRALGQLPRNGRQVDGDERRLGIPCLSVDEPGEQFLARSALPEDEDRRRQLGDLAHQIDDVGGDPARPDDELALLLVDDLGGKRQHLPVQVLALAHVPNQRPHLVVVEFFRDEVVGAVLDGLDRGLDVADRRDHDDLDQAVVLLDDAQDVQSGDARQADIQQDDVHLFTGE